ncbi:MAG: SGNH/GDSL hydrolase family protein, partial [Micrococcales bacterium]|nr:SGNH/GDSL hydrolase family protein [Micrococcales bacterium]
ALGLPSGSATSVQAGGTPRAAAPKLEAVGLGDSVPAGGHCHCTPFVVRAARTIAAGQHRAVAVTNRSASGYDSYDLARQLKSELAIVQVGANDFDSSRVAACRNRIDSCYGPDLRALRRNLTQSLRTVYQLQRNASAEVVAVGYWNVFKDGAVGRAAGPAYVIGSDRLTRRVNAVIARAARDSS